MEHPQALAAERTRVEIVDCAKTYPGGAQALRPTTLTVEPGEVLALLGPSGCGKTTLLRVIAGLVDPDRGGRILFNSDDVTSRPIEQRAVGMVFQHYALFPQMSVEANIGYGLRVRGIAPDRIRQRVGEVIELVRLGGLEQRRPAQLSGGMIKRAAMARAIIMDPRLLFLDEPSAGLDPVVAASLDELILKLRDATGMSLVVVTHELDSAFKIADRIAVLDHGDILVCGSVAEVRASPSERVQALLNRRIQPLELNPEEYLKRLTGGPVSSGATA